MNLNESIRSAFVASALADVPKIDYDDQLRTLLMKDALEAMPPKVLEMYKDPVGQTYFALRCHTIRIETNINEIDYWDKSFSFTLPCGIEDISKGVIAIAKDHILLKCLQTVQRNALSAKLTSVTKSARTRKQLLEMLPEFEKYLPAEEEKASNLPAVANVLTEFVKAGWPKKVPVVKKERSIAVAA